MRSGKFLLLVSGVVFFFIACSKHHDRPAPVVPPADTTVKPPAPPIAANGDSIYWQKIIVDTPKQAFTDIWFTDSLHGFMTASEWSSGTASIYSTIDGGLTWKKKIMGSDILRGLYFVDANKGYAIGQNELAVTTDGGQTWTVNPLHRSDTSGNFSISSYPELQFFPSGTGYLTTGQGLFKTTDNGTNWVHVYGQPANALYFSDVNNGIVYYPPTGFGKTTDGGANWQTIEPTSATSFGGASYYNLLQFSDTRNGWYLDLAKIAVTTDGGSSWQNILIRSSSDDPFADMQLFTSQDGYVATNTRILKTSDGGKSWTQDYALSKADINSPHIINSIFFTDVHHGWACCLDGTILKYTH